MTKLRLLEAAKRLPPHMIFHIIFRPFIIVIRHKKITVNIVTKEGHDDTIYIRLLAYVLKGSS